jgi:hypothetical protein
VICQLGDFGYWPHQSEGMRFLSKTEKLLAARGTVAVFIDGNHENFDLLWAVGHEVTCEGFVRLSDHLFYAPRGLRWWWRDVGFLALGGAHSIDKEWRLGLERRRRKPAQRQRWFWWPQETLTDAEVARASSNKGRVDVLLSHDCPEGVDLSGPCLPEHLAAPEITENRLRVKRVVDAVAPAAIFHGHYHFFHERPYHGDRGRATPCTGLGMEAGPKSWRVLDLDAFKGAHPERFGSRNESNHAGASDSSSHSTAST